MHDAALYKFHILFYAWRAVLYLVQRVDIQYYVASIMNAFDSRWYISVSGRLYGHANDTAAVCACKTVGLESTGAVSQLFINNPPTAQHAVALVVCLNAADSD